MGKKYIIELEDKPFHKEDGDFLYRAKGFNSLVFDMTGISKLTPYTEPDMEKVREEAYEDGYKTAKVQCNIQAEKDLREVGERHYQKGLSDAWEAARKICTNWVLPDSVLSKIFGMDKTIDDIMKENKASEAIEKIRAYEQEQEEKQHTWIFSEVNEPSVNTTLTCSKCGYTITIKPGDTQAMNFCPKCGDNKRGERDE